MKSLITLLAIYFGLISIGYANQERMLTSKDGKQISVVMLSKSAKGVTVIRKADNRKLTISMEMLSDADQRYIKSWDPKTDSTASRSSQVASTSKIKKAAPITMHRAPSGSGPHPYTGPVYRSGGSSVRRTSSGGG